MGWLMTLVLLRFWYITFPVLALIMLGLVSLDNRK